MPFREADLLVSCGRMADSCKKVRFQKYQDSCGRGLKRRFVVDADHKLTQILNPCCSFVMIVTVVSVQFVSHYSGHCLQVSFFT